MRYLLRCTEFCLVCHNKIEGGFEALKPYVCDNPLCLYQYMGLGFGPSVEHEILTQPYVVDLLVSFCYTAALNRRLREYPTGMSLHVPPVCISCFVPDPVEFMTSVSQFFCTMQNVESGNGPCHCRRSALLSDSSTDIFIGNDICNNLVCISICIHVPSAKHSNHCPSYSYC